MCLSLSALKEIDIDIEVTKEDIKKFKLPCRYELLSSSPRIILDGAHNLSKVETLFSLLSEDNISNVVCVFSIYKDKNYEDVLKFVCRNTSKIILTSITKRGRVSPDLDEMKSIASDVLSEENIYIEENNIKAFVLARKISNRNLPILITGSFTLCARIRELNFNEEKILVTRRVI